MPADKGNRILPVHTNFPTSPVAGQTVHKSGEGTFVYDGTTSRWLFQGSGKAVPYFRVFQSASAATSGNIIQFNTVDSDPNGWWDNTNKRWTPQVAGWYIFSAGYQRQNTASGHYHQLILYKNGASECQLHIAHGASGSYGFSMSGTSPPIYLNGTTDYVDARFFSSVGGNLDGTRTLTFFGGHFISDGYAGGIVTPKFSAYLTSDLLYQNSDNPITFSAEDPGGDPTNSFNTSNGRWYAPIGGWYQFNWCVHAFKTGPAVLGSTDWVYSFLKKNGATLVKQGNIDHGNGQNYGRTIGSAMVKMEAGDYMQVYQQHNFGAGSGHFSGGTFSTWFNGYLVPEPAGVLVPEGWHEVGAAGEPAFQNSWVNYGGSWNPAKFMKDPFGFVHLSGLVRNGTANTTIFTLPAGYRPATNKDMIFNVVSSTGSYAHGRMDIYSSGNVTQQNGGNTFTSLDGITFKAEA